MRHPLGWLARHSRTRLLRIFLVLTLALFAVFQVLNQPLQTRAAPAGIVSLELAGSQEKAAGMLASWDAPARLAAAFGLGLDFLFIPAYAFALCLATLLVSDQRSGFLGRIGPWLGWGTCAAALLDGLENVALLQLLLGRPGMPWPAIASGCAIGKFTLLGLGLFGALAGWSVPKARRS